MLTAVEPPAGSFIEGYNPLHSEIAQFILQMIIIVFTAKVIGHFLKKINQPAVIAEVIGGIVLGKTCLSRIPSFKDTVFPKESLENLKLVADIGLMLYLFIVGMELDPIKLATAFKKAAGISLAGIALPFASGVGVSKAIYDQYMAGSDVAFSTFFVFCGVAMSITAFPVLARILTEQNLMHTPVGEISMAAAGADDAVVWCMLILVVSLINNPSKQIDALYVFFIVVAFGVFLWICIRPIFNYMVENSEHEHGADQITITVVLLTMSASAFFTQSAGVDTIFGAFLCGLVVPHQRGFAIAMTEKIEDLVSIMFLPLYFGYAGLNVDLTTLNSPLTWAYVVLVIVVACAGKIIGCTLAALASKIPLRESIAIGILMNTKGLVELIVLNLGLKAGVISQEVYGIFVIMALVTTLMTVPIINWYYPPNYHTPGFNLEPGSNMRNSSSLSLQRKKDDLAHYRILTCLTSMRTVPAMMNLNQILFTGSTKEKEVDMYALRLKTLDARQSTVMNASSTDEQLSTVRADPVMNIFRTFGQLSSHSIKIVMAIANHSHFAEEIVQASSDIEASLIIFPIEASSTTYPSGWGKTVSTQLFDTSSTNVALFIDRGFGAATSNPKMIVKGSDQSHTVFAVVTGSNSDLQTLSLLTMIVQSSNISISILATASLDKSGLVAKTLDALSTFSNVSIRQEAIPEKIEQMNIALISAVAPFTSHDLVLVSYEIFAASPTADKTTFAYWLDHTCAASVMVVKKANVDNDPEASSLTIAAVL